MDEKKKILVIAKSFLALSAINIIIFIFAFILWGKEHYKDIGNSAFLIVFILSVLCLICSLGLLKHREWARKIFIIALSFGILWSIYSTYLAIKEERVLPVGDMPIDSNLILLSTKAVSFIVSILVVVVFGWIIKTLTKSPKGNQ